VKTLLKSAQHPHSGVGPLKSQHSQTPPSPGGTYGKRDSDLPKDKLTLTLAKKIPLR